MNGRLRSSLDSGLGWGGLGCARRRAMGPPLASTASLDVPCSWGESSLGNNFCQNGGILEGNYEYPICIPS